MKSQALTLALTIGLLMMPQMALTKTVKCQDFKKEAQSHDSVLSKKKKALEPIEKQLHSNAKAVEDFNKRCRMASKANCNPVMYNMILGQIATLSGQQQTLLSEIGTAKNKQKEALENFQACKDLTKKKRSPEIERVQ